MTNHGGTYQGRHRRPVRPSWWSRLKTWLGPQPEAEPEHDPNEREETA